jgi:hypothetical protein
MNEIRLRGLGFVNPLVLLALFAIPGDVGAQRASLRGTEITRGPVYTTDRVVFQLNGMTIQQATAMPVRLRVDSSSPSAPYAVVVPPHNCARVTDTSSLCDAPIPQETVTRLNQNGRRELYAFAYDGNCCESPPSMVLVIQGRRP